MSDRIWLTWETQRRNRTASRALGARLFEFDYAYPAMLRYPLATIRTLWAVFRERPRVIFAQNPSIVLAALVTFYGKVFGTPVIIDAHNAGIEPFDGNVGWANALTRWIMRTASLVMVSNGRLAARVRQEGGRPVILPDPLPDLHPPRVRRSLGADFNVAFICTWATDEPYLEVIKAAKAVTPGTQFLITGNSRGREEALGAPLPDNVQLTGFVSDQEFVSLLYDADLVMDLTTRPDCLVCGAYEAVAAETPMVLSDTEALRDYFSSGALYTDNSAEDIARKVNLARARSDRLGKEVAQLKEQLTAGWPEYLEQVERAIAQAVDN